MIKCEDLQQQRREAVGMLLHDTIRSKNMVVQLVASQGDAKILLFNFY
jgi:hypothetical protein